MIAAIGALSLALQPAAAAQSGKAKPAPVVLSDADAAAVQRAADRGVLIYAYDQAAWQGTDDLVANLPDAASTIAGWIVDGTATAPEIVFYDRDEAGPKAVYVANFQNNKLVSGRLLSGSDDRSISQARLAMIAARQIAAEAMAKSDASPCGTTPFNPVVLPAPWPGAATPVYFLTPQTEKDSLPFGGHYLVDVSAGKAQPVRPFTKSCISLSTSGEDGDTVALAITHLLDPVPTEIHVFSSLAAKKPVYVGTDDAAGNERTWEVTGDRIRPIK